MKAAKRTFPLIGKQRMILGQPGANLDIIGQSNFRVSLLLHLTYGWDIRRLVRAISRLSNRYAALRTRFVETDVEVRQTFDADIEINCGESADDNIENSAFLTEERSRAFDFRKGPLVRFSVVSLPDGSGGLQICASHLVMDARSVGIIRRDLIALYDSDSDSESEEEEPDNYPAYIIWENSEDGRKLKANSARAWQMLLSQRYPREVLFSTERQKTAVYDVTRQGEAGERHIKFAPISDVDEKAIGKIAIRLRLSSASILIAALFIASQHGAPVDGEEYGSLTLVDDGRWRPDLIPLCGFFSYSLPVVVLVNGSDSFEGLARRIHDHLVWARQHPNLYPPVWGEFGDVTDDSFPFGATGFNVFPKTARPEAAGGVTFSRIEMAPLFSAATSLMITVRTNTEGIGLLWDADAAVFSEATLHKVQGSFLSALTSGVADMCNTVEEIRRSIREVGGMA